MLSPSGSPIVDATFTTLLGTADGFLASGFGVVGPSGGSSPILAAGSVDGRTWQPLAADRVFGHALDGLAGGLRGWVAAERIANGSGDVGTQLWYSVDGHGWVRVADQADLGKSFPGRVAAGPWGFAMLGQAVDASQTSAGRVWVSRDGLAWRQMPRLDWDGGEIVPLRAGFLELGPERAAVTTDGVAWVDAGPLPGDTVIGDATVAPLDGDVLAVFSTADRASVWRGTVGGTESEPTVAWADAGLDMASNASVVAMATGPLGALVLGYDGQTHNPIAWVSSNGRTWQRTDLDASAFGGGVPVIAAVGGQAFVVLGWYGSEGGDVVARPWVSSDGIAWDGSRPEQLGVLPGLPSEPCPTTAPTEASELIAMGTSYPSVPQAVWPYCFQGRELVVRGYVADCGGCGGVSQFLATPDWLLDPLGYAKFWLVGSAGASRADGLSISVQIDPAHPVAVPATGAHVRVTGHFDDPAAQQCRLSPAEAGIEQPPSGVWVAWCRQQFVVTAVKVLPD